MWLEFVLMVMPVSLLIIKMMEWTENYIVLAFFLCTAIVKLCIVYLYPIIILPLFSEVTELPFWADPIKVFIKKECMQVGFKSENIFFEDSFHYDVHANASTSLNKVCLAAPLFRVHKEKPAEIISVLVHELGHHKQKWYLRQAVVDTIYMVIFGSLLYYFTNKDSFLLSFGFYQESYYVSFALFTFMYSNSLDVGIRMLMNLHVKYLEKDADLYVVSRGFGVVF